MLETKSFFPIPAIRAESPRWGAVAGALLIIALGASVVFGAGFAQLAWIHDAAHDTRHTLSLPCH